jgi:DNA-binding GntR family transcriptional regulator
MTSADVAFHMWIYEAAGNPLLTETLRHYTGTTCVAPWWRWWSRCRAAALVWDEHEHILDAVLRGDERQAEMLSLLHIQEARAAP